MQADWCRGLARSLPQLSAARPLRRLSLSGCRSLAEEALRALVPCLGSLRRLELYARAPHRTRACARLGARPRGRQAAALRYGCAVAVSDRLLLDIAQWCASLEVLDIGATPRVTDDGASDTCV